ncbi:S8 family serine peptidase [Pseudothermotoga sp.]|uniref:S8 family peptidase n=1 Tax=Pseudothermotoga sp. TaxID=2033661 RepID=UPI00258AA855|nr:S8 family serine peptidase [Pseudothermotoga sp.]MDK2883463.1 hypothetical protein [Pseudothermotoga sp.]
MKKFLLVATSIVILLTLFGCMNFQSSNNSNSDTSPGSDIPYIGSLNTKYIEKQLIIVYKDKQEAEKLIEKIDSKIIAEIPQIKAILIETPKKIEDMLKNLKSIRHEFKGIKAIEPNYIRELEPIYREENNLLKTKQPQNDYEQFQWALRVLKAQDVWDQGYTGEGIVIGLLDTGVDGTHPDLQGQLVTGYDPVYDEEILPDEDSDTYGHGTHTAGIIAAKKDDQGVTGLAYNAKIMPILIFDPSYVGDFYVARGIVWAVDHGAKILSNSWGGGGYSVILADAFNYALKSNVVIVASAGNDKTDQNWHYPSALPGVIAVGAIKVSDQNGNESTVSWSSRGEYVSVGAPGVNILSTIPVASASSEGVNKEPYAYWSGTSMACPYVSALAALILEKYPDATPYQVRKLIESTAKDIDDPGYDTSSGFGRISPVDALNGQLGEDGGILNIQVIDRDGYVVDAAYVTIKNTETGKEYYGKTFAGDYDPMYTTFTGIEPGIYEVFISGPDFLDMNALNYRMEEELQYSFSASADGQINVVEFESTFEADIMPETSLPDGVTFDVFLVNYLTDEVLDSVVDATNTAHLSLPESAEAGYYELRYEIHDSRPLETLDEEGFESGEFRPDWTLGGDAEPFIQSDIVYNGNYAVQFGDIDDFGKSWFEFTLQTDEPVNVSFMLKVSSEASFDYFKLYVDGNEEYKNSGEVDWQEVSVEMSPGTHTVRFAYEKDVSISRGSDTAWVDDIKIQSGTGLGSFSLIGTVTINGNDVEVHSIGGNIGIIDDGLETPWCIY